MSAATSRTSHLLPFERLRAAADVLKQEAAMLTRLAANVPMGLDAAIECLLHCEGSVIVTGMGKAGWIGQKISASLASTGTRSHFLHPAEAFHGDLGRVAPQDVILALSNSGETGELTQILPALKRTARAIISITANAESTLGQFSDVVIDYGSIDEACHLGLAPSTSTTAMLALGDALALVTSQARQFAAEDFARFHPGGSLGKRLATVDDLMKPLAECRIAKTGDIVRDTYGRKTVAGRRVGVILIVDDAGLLAGLFTDSDLVRLLERRQECMLDQPIDSVMTRNPISIPSGSKFEQAIQILAARNISELPVIDEYRRPIGLVDITDVVGLLPVNQEQA